MNEIIHKNAKRFLAGIGALLLCFSSVTVPCFADTTYYSYNYYNLGEDNGVYSLNLNVSTIHPVVLSVNYNGKVSYYLYFCLYAGGFTTNQSAQSYANLYANLTAIPKYINNSSSTNWTYGSQLNGAIATGNFTNSSGNTEYYYYSYIGIGSFNRSGNSYITWDGATSNPSFGSSKRANGVYCFNNTDLFTGTTGEMILVSSAMESYIKFKLTGDLTSGYTIANVPAKTWLKSSDTLVPVFDVSNLPDGDGSTSDSGGNAGPATPTPDSGTGGGSGSNSSMSQTQSIASGAVAFTVEDGAFSQTQTQTIESNAVNVNVTNNNELTNENLNHINQIINNNPETTENTFQDAISNMNQFRAMAAAFAALAGVVLGWLPSWVTGLIGLSFSILSVMIIFRLIHLFV